MNDINSYQGTAISILNPFSYVAADDNVENSKYKKTKKARKLANKKEGTHSSMDSHNSSQSPSKSRKSKKDSDDHYKSGRWQPEEHQRFLEAIVQYGNEWKKVEEYVGSRSSTQARSHAQKFFVKFKKTNLLDLDINLNKSSIRRLQEVADQMNSTDYLKTISKFNNLAYEKKATTNIQKIKRKIDENDKESMESLPNKLETNNSNHNMDKILNKEKILENEKNPNIKDNKFYDEPPNLKKNKNLNVNKNSIKNMKIPSNIKIFRMNSGNNNKNLDENKNRNIISNFEQNNVTDIITNLDGPSLNSNRILQNKRSRKSSFENHNNTWEPFNNLINSHKIINPININLFDSANLLPKFEDDNHFNNFFIDPFNEKNLHIKDFSVLDNDLGNLSNKSLTNNFNVNHPNTGDLCIDNMFNLEGNSSAGKDRTKFEI